MGVAYSSVPGKDTHVRMPLVYSSNGCTISDDYAANTLKVQYFTCQAVEGEGSQGDGFVCFLMPRLRQCGRLYGLAWPGLAWSGLVLLSGLDRASHNVAQLGQRH